MSQRPVERGPGGIPIDFFRDCRALRVCLRGGARPDLIVGVPGVLVVHAIPQQRMPGLILMSDEPGTGSLSAARYGLILVMALRSEFAGLQPEVNNIVVESEAGGLEHLVLTWRDSAPVEAYRTAVRWPEAAPGSSEALVGAFGYQARRALATKAMLQRNPYRARFP